MIVLIEDLTLLFIHMDVDFLGKWINVGRRQHWVKYKSLIKFCANECNFSGRFHRKTNVIHDVRIRFEHRQGVVTMFPSNLG